MFVFLFGVDSNAIGGSQLRQGAGEDIFLYLGKESQLRAMLHKPADAAKNRRAGECSRRGEHVMRWETSSHDAGAPL